MGKCSSRGGRDNGYNFDPTAAVELYDPVSGTWTATGAMTFARYGHTATLLPNGKVLVAGGSSNGNALFGAELYDPETGKWMVTDGMNTARNFHTATLLHDGKVLAVGGYNNGYVSSAELYDPVSGTWTATGGLNIARRVHTATLLGNGKVLVTAGYGASGITNSTELYDPANGTWMTNGALATARYDHTATLLPDGKLLVAGGRDTSFNPTTSAEAYDPVTGRWATTNSLTTARYLHTTTLLPSGKVLIAGGLGSGGVSLSGTELYDPATGTWTTNGALTTARGIHTATLLPNGKVLITGGYNYTSLYGNPLASTELYDLSNGTWTPTGALTIQRFNHTATLLANGKVLIAGGETNLWSPFVTPTSSAELYDPATATWAMTGAMTTPRDSHTATLLHNGKVLVAGGADDTAPTLLSSAELYDPATETCRETGSMNAGRLSHTATLLPNGKLLVAGGYGNVGDSLDSLSSAELYDPATGTWMVTGALNTLRRHHTATLLPSGKALVAGGFGSGNSTLSSAELYEPAIGTWTTTGGLTTEEWGIRTATLLPDGKVLVAKGYEYIGPGSGWLPVAEMYDPDAGAWTVTGVLSIGGGFHSAVLLADGKVLIAGGYAPGSVYLRSAEVYDPATRTWTPTGALTTARKNHTATLLANGKVLVTGGYQDNGIVLASTELYDVGLGFNASWQPQIATATSPLSLGSSLALTGSQFRGISGASGGNTQDSPADYPVVQLRSIESGQTTFLLSTNWSTNSFISTPVWNFPPGYALATVFVNGIPSTASVLNINVPVPTAPILTDVQTLTNGSFQFAFTNSVGALFGVLATTNLTLPSSNWTMLSGVTEVSPGQFQFTDPQATNLPERFYQVRSP